MGPQQTPGTNQPQIDPTALNLARAIRQVESGDNPNAKGASGEFGIGQWMPGNFEAAATKYGLDPNDKSQGNQEHVLYNQIEEQLKAGHSQSEVASWWNSGKYDPTGNVGVNKEGVAYNTPAYVEKVKQAYVQATQGQPSPSQGYVPPAQPGQVQQPQPGSSNVGYAPPAPPPPSSTSDTTKTSDQNYVQNIDPATGKPSQSINWANPPEWFPGKGLAELGGSLIAKYTPSWMGLGGVGGTNAAQNVQFPSAERVVGSALQTAGDIAALATLNPELAPSSFLGMVGTGAGLGAAQSGGSAMTQNAPTSQVLQQGTIGGAIGGATGAIGFGLGKLLDSLSTKSVSMAIRPNAKDLSDGYSGQFAVDNGLTGNASQVAQKTDDFIKGKVAELNSKLAGSGSSIDLADIFDKVKSALTQGKGLLTQSGQNASIGRALKQFQDEVLAVNPTGSLSIPDSQIVKQAWGSMGEWVGGTADPDAGALGTVYNKAYSTLRQAIEDASPDGVREINAQIQQAIPIIRAAIRRIPVAERNGISLTDMLAILGSPMNPAGLALSGAQHAMQSGLASKVLPSVSKNVVGMNPLASGLTAGLISPSFSSKSQ